MTFNELSLIRLKRAKETVKNLAAPSKEEIEKISLKEGDLHKYRRVSKKHK